MPPRKYDDVTPYYDKKRKIIDNIPLDSKLRPKSKIESKKILALKSTDFDLKNKTLHIQRTLTKDRYGQIIIGERTKTEAGNRIVPIPENIYSYVLEQLKVAKNNKENMLFLNKGRLINHSSINSQLMRRLINLGIYKKGMSTHSLRHTFATRCIESGMQQIVVSKLMGHSNIRVTLDTYVTVFNDFKENSSKMVNEYYKNLKLFKKDINNEKGQKIEKNSRKNSKIIQFPKKHIANDTYER